MLRLCRNVRTVNWVKPRRRFRPDSLLPQRKSRPPMRATGQVRAKPASMHENQRVHSPPIAIELFRIAESGGFLLTLPTLHEQRAIAHIIGTLDDKIELNRRMDETLEAIARTIFKDWFVDFGPTRAMMEGREPYFAPKLWDLFADALDKEDKSIGSQWETLAEIADSPRRGISPSNVVRNTPYIGLEHMPHRSIVLSEWETAYKVKSSMSQY